MVEHNLAKVGVVGSNPIARSKFIIDVQSVTSDRDFHACLGCYMGKQGEAARQDFRAPGTRRQRPYKEGIRCCESEKTKNARAFTA